jgi:hypothetical protein
LGLLFNLFFFSPFLRKLFPLEIRLNFRKFQVGVLAGSVGVCLKRKAVYCSLFPLLVQAGRCFPSYSLLPFLISFIST